MYLRVAKWIAMPLMSTSRHTPIRDLGSCISTRKRRFQLDGQDSMIEDLKEAEGLLEEALLTRSERYKLIEDMSISATKTAGVMSGIKKLNSQINGYQNKVNEIKRQVGYHEDEILKSEKRKRTVL